MISKCKRIAKEKLQGNYPIFIWITLIITIISSIFSVLFIDYEIKRESLVVHISWWYYLLYLIAPVFQMSMIYCTFKVLNNEKPIKSDIISGFNKYFKIVWTYFLVSIYIMFWSILIIPIFIKPFSYAMTMRIIKDDPYLSAEEAITKSREMMKGYKFKLFSLYLSFIGWMFLSLLTFGILFLWLYPYIETSISQFYLDIIEKSKKRMNKAGVECGKTIAFEDLELYLKEKKCPLCGKMHSYTASYCTECGRKLDEESSDYEKKCPSCGKIYPVSSYYCPDCGRKLD